MDEARGVKTAREETARVLRVTGCDGGERGAFAESRASQREKVSRNELQETAGCSRLSPSQYQEVLSSHTEPDLS